MDTAILVETAEEMLDSYRGMLLIDPFYKISIEVAEGDFHSKCVKEEKSSFSWVVKLSPSKNQDDYDIQYSVLEALLKILFYPLGPPTEAINGVVSRLTTTFCTLFGDEDDEEEDGD